MNILEAKSLYSDEWEETSLNFKNKGFYNWCIEQIKNSNSIIEIGAGCGFSTDFIISNNKRVFSIEENEINFEKIKNKLKNTDNISFIINPEDENNLNENNIVLTNFLTDERLHSNLISKISFDTIILWFLGVHSMAHFDIDLNNIGYKEKNTGDYRDLIYKKIFTETSKSLPKNGIINLIERGAYIETKEEEENIKEQYKKYYQFDKYDLKIQSLTQIEVEDLMKISGINMKLTNSDGNIINKKVKHALMSIIIVKK